METTSKAVADHFKQSHRRILTVISNLTCSSSFKDANFRLSKFVDSNGRSHPQYKISQEGYVWLCMTFTSSAKALRWKEELILDYKLPLLDWDKISL